MNDTPVDIARMVHARLMALDGATRFRMGVESFEAARRMVVASLPVGLSDIERKRLLFERIYGEKWPIQTAGVA